MGLRRARRRPLRGGEAPDDERDRYAPLNRYAPLHRYALVNRCPVRPPAQIMQQGYTCCSAVALLLIVRATRYELITGPHRPH